MRWTAVAFHATLRGRDLQREPVVHLGAVVDMAAAAAAAIDSQPRFAVISNAGSAHEAPTAGTNIPGLADRAPGPAPRADAAAVAAAAMVAVASFQ